MFKFIAPKFIFKVEKWKWNKEFRLYVSNTGKFRDEHKQPVPIKLNQNGYIVIKTRNGIQTAHRLVMKTWMPTEDMDNLTVDHLDHNKRNNCVENLEWVTFNENQRRAREDHLPSAIKTTKVQKKVADKAHRKANPQRYHNPNLTENDLLYYVNGVECATLDAAVALGKEIFLSKAVVGSAGPQPDHWADHILRNKFIDRLNACRNFHPEAIDGTKHFHVYKYLEIWTVVKEDVE
jgi:hypothetical protein